MKLIHTPLKQAKVERRALPTSPPTMAPQPSILLTLTLLLALLTTAVLAKSSFAISDVKFAVVGSDGVRRGGESLEFPGKLASKYSVQGSDTVRLTFQVKDAETDKSVQPHQAFLILTNDETGVQSVQILQVRDSGKARAELSPKTADENLVGPYTLEVVLGTFSLPDPLKYALGSINIESTFDLSKSAESATTAAVIYGPRPEIRHIFRQPDKVPAAWLSNAFVLVVLSPWLVLLGAWLALGITPAILGPFVSSISILAFFSTLVATEFLFYKYWTSLNIFETLTYFAGLSVFTFVTGQRALSEVQARRLKNEGKYAKKE
ncbi:Dolichyl-diphosphooligosaccharide--protein glycosyltransferase subunit Swp1 [Jimgerdemannia flammicorona]|uniref:Dolichyl-diphosphooligosaccharide--protein glycosyltransferase subunit Swp1 n=2 Tax=Jimgerdemannia flammicorona TaxID=994334 RepID=A0A433DNJ7_9FUNG|nr:Dolichyl-diphosphooligosaccharide--protein glycosyltransferase subunit Swp1 [Jimgerdemannia flammicorona]RUS31213.1 Dolichyl-diphosphooligosaccharide--protein glycosyltransferase subunit Swp1 [Jimgerdemannia flammicorona]